MADTGNAKEDGNAAGEQAQGIPPQQNRAATPSEREIAERNNDRATKNRERFIKRPIRLTVGYLDRHDGLITAAATAAIAALTLSLSIDSSRQADTARKQFNIMQGQLEEMRNQRLATIAQSRANLRRTNIATHAVNPNNSYVDTAGEQIVAFGVNPVWKNVGSTDARNYIGWWDAFIVPGPADANGRIKLQCPIPPRPAEKILPSILPPTQEFTLLAKRITTADIVAAHEHKKTIYLAGRAEYDDIFVPETKRHHLDWCVLMEPYDPTKNLFSFPNLREEAD